MRTKNIYNPASQPGGWADFRDSLDRSKNLLREYTSPEPGTISDPDWLGSELAWVAMWSVKLDLAEHKAEDPNLDEGAILRALGDRILDLAYDWAEQFEGGATDYS